MLGFLRAYLGWSIKPTSQNYQISKCLFIAILCAKISSVYKPILRKEATLTANQYHKTFLDNTQININKYINPITLALILNYNFV